MTTVAISLIAIVLLGAAFEAWARSRDAKIWTHPGTLVDVGGHKLHCRTWGEGEVVIVFESDEGAWSTHWGRLPEELGGVSTTMSYDRGGLGWSEPGPPPRDAETLARELHQLLARVAPGKPAILVGHGTAAHILRAYSHRYPFETAGLVLVDPYHDGIADRLRREQIPSLSPSPMVMRISSMLASIGVVRLLQGKSSGNAELPLPERQRATLDALELAPRVRRGAADELSAEKLSLEYLGRIQESGDLPMRILASTSTLSPDLAGPDFPTDEYNRLWTEQSGEFLDLSKRATRVLVDGVGHQIQLERPDVVGQAILEVMDEALELRAQQAEESAENVARATSGEEAS